MSESILVVDPGLTWTTAAVVGNSTSQLLKEPSSGSYCWPTAVALDGAVLRVGTVAERRKRSNPLLYAGRLPERLGSGETVVLGDRSYQSHELLAHLLGSLKIEAERLASVPISRILVLAADDRSPTTAAGRGTIEAASAAGFADVELLFLPMAVTMAAVAPAAQPAGAEAARSPARKGTWPAAGRLVLVCDAGAGALRLTLMQTTDGQAGTLRARAAVTACGGDKLDALLTEAIQRKNAKWLRPMLAAAGPAGGRARLDLADLARRMRHELTDSDQAEDILTPLAPAVRFSRQDLERMMKPALGQLSSACRDVLAKAGTATVSEVMLVGGCARTPALGHALAAVLARSVRPAPAPELAALRGGIEWAGSAARRRVAAVPVSVGLRELAWEIPAGAARLTGWNVARGASYGAGEPLARIRAEDDAVWDLITDEPGVLEQRCADTGEIVATADVLAISRPAAISPSDRRDSPLRLCVLRGGAFAAFSQDGRQLATLDAARTIRIWDTETAAELARFEVSPRATPKGLAAVRRPDGHWLVAFFDGTAVVVRDVTAGRQTARIAKGSDAKTVQFSSDGLRLCTAEAKRTRIWDVSGRELISVKERLLSSDAVTMSRDGRWLALASHAGLVVWDTAARKRTVARPLPRFKGRVWQLAFSSDAERILFAVDSRMEMITLPSGGGLWAVDVPSPVLDADFAPDDGMLATVGQAQASSPTLVRDSITGSEVFRVGAASGVARFSPDGRFLLTSEGDSAVLWALVH